jgi:hypothetical protein
MKPGPHAPKRRKFAATQQYIFEILNMITAFKLKIPIIRIYLGLHFSPIKPSTGLPNLMRLSLLLVVLSLGLMNAIPLSLPIFLMRTSLYKISQIVKMFIFTWISCTCQPGLW